MMLHRGSNCLAQVFRCAGLGKKPEDLSLIDRGNGRFDVTVSSQQHPHSVWGLLSNTRKESCSVHAWHAHVGDDNGEGAFVCQNFEAHLTIGCGQHLIVPTQLKRQPIEDPRFVVNAKEFLKLWQ
jgi:hypothetical protein